MTSRNARAYTSRILEAQAIDPALRTRGVEYLRDCFELMQGDEGSLWLATSDEREIVMAINTGPRASQLEWKVREPLSEGVVSTAYRTRAIQNDDRMFHRQDFSHLIDDAQGQQTFNLSAAPLLVLGECVGVLSVVQIGVASQRTHRKVWGFPTNLSLLWSVATAGFAAILEAHVI